MKYENILEGIGSTPHVRINHIFPGALNIWMKLERNNPGGSIKDRIALAMIRDAEEQGVLKSGSTILGGETVIGHHTVVGGNTWITESILPHSVVYRNHRVLVKDRKDFTQPNDFEI